MTRFQKWMLKRIARVLVFQGPEHQVRITAYYEIMHRAARREFREDNRVTLDDFLRECHTDAAGNDYMRIMYKCVEIGT